MANNGIPGTDLTNDDFLNVFQSLMHSHSNDRDSDFVNDMISSLNSNNNDFVVPFDDNEQEQVNPSSYYTENQLVSHFSNLDKTVFSMFHTNIRSMNRNFECLRNLLDQRLNLKCSVIGLTETWLSDTPHSLYSLQGYDLIVNNRPNRQGGGVALYIKTDFNFTQKTALNHVNDSIETIFIEIEFVGRKNIVIGIIYRPPNSSHNDFLLNLQNILSNPILRSKDCFLMGDFNANLLKYDTDSFVHEFYGTLLTSSFIPLISKPTRMSEQSSTLIDNIFTNMHPFPHAGVVISDITDHFPIFANFPILQQAQQPSKIYPRNFSEGNISTFKDRLDEFDWGNIYDMNEVNNCFDDFMDNLTNLFNECLPVRQSNQRSRKRTPRSPWITNSLLRCINRKNNLFLKYKAKPTENNKSRYLNYKNTLTGLLRREKRNYFSCQFTKCKRDAKNTWKIINEVLNKHEKKNSVSKIKIGNRIIDNVQEISDHFNNFFVEIGPDLARKIPDSDKSFHEYLPNPNPNSMFLPLWMKVKF